MENLEAQKSSPPFVKTEKKVDGRRRRQQLLDAYQVIGRYVYQRYRSAAARAVMKARIDGRLPPIDQCYCVDCGAMAQAYDHRDYGLPLSVVPVCHNCNAQRGAAELKTDRIRLDLGCYYELGFTDAWERLTGDQSLTLDCNAVETRRR